MVFFERGTPQPPPSTETDGKANNSEEEGDVVDRAIQLSNALIDFGVRPEDLPWGGGRGDDEDNGE